jgi:hypothetical protein
MRRQRHREHAEEQAAERPLTARRAAAICKPALAVAPIFPMPPFAFVPQPENVVQRHLNAQGSKMFTIERRDGYAES